MNKYYVCGGSDSHWIATNAKTIDSAKAAGTKLYGERVGVTIEVAELVGEGDAAHYEQVAVKHGYNKWVTAY